MPRVLPGGPSLAVSADNAWVAVADHGRLSLVDARERRELGEATLAGSDGDVAFCGATPRLLAVTRTEAHTEVAAYLAPSLELLARLELPGPPMRALAFVGDRVLLAQDDGEAAKIVTLTTRLLIPDPIPLRPPTWVAAAAPEDRLLVETRGQLEFWDPVLKRALFRLNLPLPPAPKAIGFAGRGRLLWVAAREAGRFEVFRFSDGRKQLQVDLGGETLAVEGSSTNNRIIVALRMTREGPIELNQIDLGVRERQVLEVEHPLAGFAVVEGEQPLIVAAAAGAPLAFVPLSKASGGARSVAIALAAGAQVEESFSVKAADVRAQAPMVAFASSDVAVEAAPPAVPATGKRTTAADRFAAWRARLQGPKTADGEEETAPPATATAATATVATPSEEARGGAAGRAKAEPVEEPAKPREEGARSAKAVIRARGEAAERAAAAVEREMGAPAAKTATPEEAGWRARLATWGRAVLDGERPGEAPPLDGAAPVVAVAERFALEPAATRALGFLYAAWLLGRGDGVPAAEVARAIRDDDDWAESLGRGQLGRAGIARARRGRLALRRVVGDLLDGAAPRTPIARPERPLADAPALAAAVVALHGEPLDAAAARLANRLGRPVAVIDLDQARRRGKRLRDGLFEARALGAVPLLAGLRADELARVEGAALFAVDGARPPALAHLPELPSAAEPAS